jgi:hypothetical protein
MALRPQTPSLRARQASPTDARTRAERAIMPVRTKYGRESTARNR